MRTAYDFSPPYRSKSGVDRVADLIHTAMREKTPFYVITIDEEYTMMKFLGYQFNSQSLQSLDGHKFDVFTATNTKTGEKVKLFFNIDIVWAAETKLFGN